MEQTRKTKHVPGTSKATSAGALSVYCEESVLRRAGPYTIPAERQCVYSRYDRSPLARCSNMLTSHIRDMNRESTQCVELIQETVSVLGDSNLQLLLVSTQQVNIEICIIYALKECVMLLDVTNRKFC